ncbi:fungal specific transcription factor domain-containing protein [Microdochium nivale]|nr:fungal specific transcription factor domain-containing protein [Microdochium nivale]
MADMGRRVQELLENRDGFFHVHRHFMFGRNFSDEYQAAVKRLFQHSPHTMAAAYDAVLSQLDLSSMQVRDDGRAGQDLKAGSDCIKALIEASSSVTKPEDAALVMMLAQILFVYNMAIGWPAAHMVVRSSLLAIKDWYPILTKQPAFDSIVITPVLLDTIDCLVKREVPVIRLDCSDRVPIDRLLGLCATLLPLMYDLCELSHRAAHSPRTREASSPHEFEARYRSTYYDDEYTAVEQQIAAWSPTWPPHFLTAYSSVEVVTMLAQARLYRASSLLILHRLRFPLGIEDRVARCHADAILNEFCNIEAWTSNPDHGLRFATDFPLLVATLELPERGSAIVERLKPMRIQPRNSKGIIEFAGAARRAMHEGYMGLWFDLAEKKLHVEIMP